MKTKKKMNMRQKEVTRKTERDKEKKNGQQLDSYIKEPVEKFILSSFPFGIFSSVFFVHFSTDPLQNESQRPFLQKVGRTNKNLKRKEGENEDKTRLTQGYACEEFRQTRSHLTLRVNKIQMTGQPFTN